MRKLRGARLARVVLAGVVASQACAPFESGAAPDVVSAPTADASVDAPPEPYEPPPPCDPNERAEEGVFVSAAFGLPGGLGTPETPMRNIADALEVAAAKGTTRVYVDEGTYEESLAFTDRHAGILVIGGFQGSEAGWRKDCAEGFRARTILQSPAPVAVRVTATKSAEPSGLEAITVTTSVPVKAAADEGGVSTVGIFVEGPAAFRLKIVKVVAARAGDAGDVTPFGPAGTRTCQGRSDCSNGSAGTNGANGPAATAGSFGAAGFVPGDAQPGGSGSVGANGAQAANPQSDSCATETTGQCNDTMNPPFCGFISQNVTAQRGTCGCGGEPGSGGRPGRGGGASIGLLVIGSGTVSADNTNLTAVGGGAGAAGGAGQPGGAPGTGVKGNNAICFKGSVQSGPQGTGCRCELANPTTLQGSNPGGSGGKGGGGGNGGGGAGGPAHAWVTVGGGRVLEGEGFTPSVGPGGPGGAGAPSGDSSASRVVEAIADAGTD